MTVYKLLIDSPRYEATMKKIKAMAKREKRKIEVVGQDISFMADTSTRYIRGPWKEFCGSGVVVTVS